MLCPDMYLQFFNLNETQKSASKRPISVLFCYRVGQEGIEPSRSSDRQILSLLRMPISPLPRCDLDSSTRAAGCQSVCAPAYYCAPARKDAKLDPYNIRTRSAAWRRFFAGFTP